MDGLYVHLGQADKVVGAGVGAHERMVAGAAGGIQLAVVIGRANGNAAGAGAPGILAFGMVKVLLRVLIDAQRDHVQHLGLGDLGDAAPGLLDAGEAKVMPQDRVGGLPADALHGGIGVGHLAARLTLLAPEVGDDIIGGLVAIKDALEKAEPACAFGDEGRAAKGKAHAGAVELVGLLGKGPQQPLAVLGGEAIGYGHEIRLLPLGGLQDVGDGNGRAQKDSSPAGLLGQTEKAHDAGHMGALAQGRGYDGLHGQLLCARFRRLEAASQGSDGWVATCHLRTRCC